MHNRWLKNFMQIPYIKKKKKIINTLNKQSWHLKEFDSTQPRLSILRLCNWFKTTTTTTKNNNNNNKLALRYPTSLAFGQFVENWVWIELPKPRWTVGWEPETIQVNHLTFDQWFYYFCCIVPQKHKEWITEIKISCMSQLRCMVWSSL